MRSKWEWIRDACKELGNYEAAGIAEEIEVVLKEIYGDTKTIAWMRDYIDIKDRYSEVCTSDIECVATNPFYCIACVEDIECDNCRFWKHSGLYARFHNALP